MLTIVTNTASSCIQWLEHDSLIQEAVQEIFGL